MALWLLEISSSDKCNGVTTRLYGESVVTSYKAFRINKGCTQMRERDAQSSSFPTNLRSEVLHMPCVEAILSSQTGKCLRWCCIFVVARDDFILSPAAEKSSPPSVLHVTNPDGRPINFS